MCLFAAISLFYFSCEYTPRIKTTYHMYYLVENDSLVPVVDSLITVTRVEDTKKTKYFMRSVDNDTIPIVGNIVDITYTIIEEGNIMKSTHLDYEVLTNVGEKIGYLSIMHKDSTESSNNKFPEKYVYYYGRIEDVPFKEKLSDIQRQEQENITSLTDIGIVTKTNMSTGEKDKRRWLMYPDWGVEEKRREE